jgi:hypothetical protein
MKTWLVHKTSHGGPTKGYIQNVWCPRNSTSTHHGVSILNVTPFKTQQLTIMRRAKIKNM